MSGERAPEIITDEKWATIIQSRNLLNGLMEVYEDKIEGGEPSTDEGRQILREFTQRTYNYLKQDSRFTEETDEELERQGYISLGFHTFFKDGMTRDTHTIYGILAKVLYDDIQITESRNGILTIWKREQ